MSCELFISKDICVKSRELTAYNVSSHIEVGKTTVSNGSDSLCNSFLQCVNNCSGKDIRPNIMIISPSRGSSLPDLFDPAGLDPFCVANRIFWH
jgi:hypothetical protein